MKHSKQQTVIKIIGLAEWNNFKRLLFFHKKQAVAYRGIVSINKLNEDINKSMRF